MLLSPSQSPVINPFKHAMMDVILGKHSPQPSNVLALKDAILE